MKRKMPRSSSKRDRRLRPLRETAGSRRESCWRGLWRVVACPACVHAASVPPRQSDTRIAPKWSSTCRRDDRACVVARICLKFLIVRTRRRVRAPQRVMLMLDLLVELNILIRRALKVKPQVDDRHAGGARVTRRPASVRSSRRAVWRCDPSGSRWRRRREGRGCCAVPIGSRWWRRRRGGRVCCAVPIGSRWWRRRRGGRVCCAVPIGSPA